MSLVSVSMSGKCDNLTENCPTIKRFKTFENISNLQNTPCFIQPLWTGFLHEKCYIISGEQSAVRGSEVGHVDKPCTWRGVLRLAGAPTIKTDRKETEC